MQEYIKKEFVKDLEESECNLECRKTFVIRMRGKYQVCEATIFNWIRESKN